MTRPSGYIIESPYHGALRLRWASYYRDEKALPRPILLPDQRMGWPATLFATYDDARGALRRLERFLRRHDHLSELYPRPAACRIVKLELEEHP